jgi:hypothetical protein
MSEFKVSIWKQEDGGWCYQIDGDNRVYVLNTKRAVLNAVEKELDKAYGIQKQDAGE